MTISSTAEAIDASYGRFLDRLERQVIDSITQRKVELEFGTLTAASVMSLPVTDFNLHSELQFITRDAVREGAKSEGVTLSDTEVEALSDSVLDTSDRANQTTYLAVKAAFDEMYGMQIDSHSGRFAALALLLLLVFAGRRRHTKLVSEYVALSSFNSGAHRSALMNGKVKKTWVSKHDKHVRSAHRKLDGDTVLLDDVFHVDGIPIRFPGDPLAPIHLVVNCRCHLKYSAS